MRYPFIKDKDNTEIVFSEVKEDGDVLVFFERWDEIIDDFDSMTLSLKTGKVTDVVGFSDVEVEEKTDYILNMSPLIYRFSRQGGVCCRA